MDSEATPESLLFKICFFEGVGLAFILAVGLSLLGCFLEMSFECRGGVVVLTLSFISAYMGGLSISSSSFAYLFYLAAVVFESLSFFSGL